MFSALQSTFGPVTDFENNVQIDAYLATLSFLKLVRNWPKNAVPNLAPLCCGAIWRRREKPQYNYNPSCIQVLKKDFWKITYCMTFGAHKLAHSEPVLDY